MSEMSKRIISAAFLAPIVLFSVAYMPDSIFLIFVSVFAGIIGYEWLGIYHFKKWICILYGLFCCLLSITFSSDFVAQIVIFSATLIWLLSTWFVFTFSPSSVPKRLRAMLNGLLLVPAGAVSIFWLRLDWDYWLLIVVLLQVWSIDVIGYVIGKHWGREKLIPSVSPNKTWEGFYAQLVVGLLFGIIFYYGFDILLSKALAIAVLTTLASVLGDLYESTLKRENGVKESGSLMVGHGGFLDRTDGLIAAAPFCWSLLNIV